MHRRRENFDLTFFIPVHVDSIKIIMNLLRLPGKQYPLQNSVPAQQGQCCAPRRASQVARSGPCDPARFKHVINAPHAGPEPLERDRTARRRLAMPLEFKKSQNISSFFSVVVVYNNRCPFVRIRFALRMIYQSHSELAI